MKRTLLFLDKDSNLGEMKANPAFSANLHQNADSWRVFGDLCRRELERRAYEETDLVKVSLPFLILFPVFFFL